MWKKRVVMIGPSPTAQGGISSVVNIYGRQGVFNEWDICYLASYRDGAPYLKLTALFRSLMIVIWMLILGRVSLFHIHTSSRTSFWRKSLFFLLANVTRTPYLIHLHGGGFLHFYENECGKAAQRIISAIFNRAERVVVLSPTWKDKLPKVTSNPNIEPIPNPVMPVVDHDADLPVRSKCKLLFLGRLSKEKGLYDLLNVISRVRPQHPDIELICGGDGGLDEVKRYIATHELSANVHLVGWVSGDRKQQLLEASSIYLLPSYYEGLPMGLLEAMSVGMAVIASNVGGIPDIIDDGEDGLMVEPGDTDALELAIRILLNDDALRTKLGMAAQEKVKGHYSIAVVQSKLNKLYRGLGLQQSG